MAQWTLQGNVRRNKLENGGDCDNATEWKYLERSEAWVLEKVTVDENCLSSAERTKKLIGMSRAENNVWELPLVKKAFKSAEEN